MKLKKIQNEEIILGDINSNVEKVISFGSNTNNIQWLKSIDDSKTIETMDLTDEYVLNFIYKLEKNKSKYSSKSVLNRSETTKPAVIKAHYDKYCDFIYKMIKRDTFEIGYDNETIRFIRKEVNKDKDLVLKSLQQVLVKYSSDDDIWIAILHVLSDLTYKESEPYGVFVAGSCLSRKNIQIKEMAVMLFEQWANEEALNFLCDMETGVSWLDDYISNVIEDIRLEMNINGVSS